MEVVDAYPPYSDLERFEKKEEVHRPEEGGYPSGIEALKFKLLRMWNADAYLEEQGKEVVAKYNYLVPTEAQKFEFEHVTARKDGTKTLHFLPRSGSVGNKWSLAIKQAYEHHQPTDLELFEKELICEDGDVNKMELHLMQKGETAFEGHGKEVRRKWSWLCPTPEERFEYLFFYKDERGQLRPNDRFLLEREYAFEGFSEHIKKKYAIYVPSTW